MAEAANSGRGAGLAQGAWARGLVVAIAASAFLAISGAFGTGHMPLAGRFAYWIFLLALGTLWGVSVSRRVFARVATPLWRPILLSSLLIAGPGVGVVWLTNTLLTGRPEGWAATLGLFLAVLVISVVVTTINVLVARSRAGPVVTIEAPAPPRFLERLPLKLRGAEVWAVEAEDHYLRLHTSKGQDLILLRLADAVAELEGIEGAQVHRSWWVAREAIADARRSDGRALLTLKDGSQVPVSRTYAKTLRERGWI